ncbi:DUF427 domain-containing protein [soil metagenome]
MALALGTGPFGPQRNGEFNFDTGVLQAHTLYFEDSPKRVRSIFGGETVADSRRVKMLHETGHLPVYYFPMEDIRQDLLEAGDRTTHCPFKGDASYYSVRAGDRVAENAIWYYPEPLEFSASLKGYAAFYWRKMDAWMEEDEKVIGHPHDPYHRVDVLESSRQIRVTLDDEELAASDRPKILFETALPTRYYLPTEDVRMDLLVPSDTETICPYKGIASYYSTQGGTADVAWSYPDPLPEAEKVKDYICLYSEKARIEVDGEKID